MLVAHLGKGATFRKNILAVTRRTSLDRALKGWAVVRSFQLTNKEDEASCELCGTRFRIGAVMRHARHGATLTIGGVCAENIRLATFGSRRAYRERRRATWQVFKAHYGNSMVRGAWVTWLFNNAPRRFAAAVLDLKTLGAVRSDAEMEDLIVFHDVHRRYPARALLHDLELLRAAGVRGIPAYLTLAQARQLREKFSTKQTQAMFQVRSEQYKQRDFRRYIRAVPGAREAWRSLNDPAQDAVLALAVLSEQRMDERLVPELTNSFQPAKPSYKGPQFIWNPDMGLALVPADGYRGNGTAYVRYWGRGRDASRPVALRYFYSPTPRAIEAVHKLQQLAFTTDLSSDFTARGRA